MRTRSKPPSTLSERAWTSAEVHLPVLSFSAFPSVPGHRERDSRNFAGRSATLATRVLIGSSSVSVPLPLPPLSFTPSASTSPPPREKRSARSTAALVHLQSSWQLRSSSARVPTRCVTYIRFRSRHLAASQSKRNSRKRRKLKNQERRKLNVVTKLKSFVAGHFDWISISANARGTVVCPIVQWENSALFQISKRSQTAPVLRCDRGHVSRGPQPSPVIPLGTVVIR